MAIIEGHTQMESYHHFDVAAAASAARCALSFGSEMV